MHQHATGVHRNYLLPEIESTAYTSSVTGGYIFAPYSEGLSYPEESEDITYTPLLVTSDQAVSKTDVANAETSELEDGDIAGPFTIALAAEQDVDDDNTMKLVVFGSTEMLTDNADSIVSGRNVSMFSDVLGQLAATTESRRASFRSRSIRLNDYGYVTGNADRRTCGNGYPADSADCDRCCDLGGKEKEIMKKQKKQFFGMLILVPKLAAAYGGIHVYNQKQEEKEAGEEKTEKLTVVDFETDDVTAFCTCWAVRCMPTRKRTESDLGRGYFTHPRHVTDRRHAGCGHGALRRRVRLQTARIWRSMVWKIRRDHHPHHGRRHDDAAARR